MTELYGQDTNHIPNSAKTILEMREAKQIKSPNSVTTTAIDPEKGYPISHTTHTTTERAKFTVAQDGGMEDADLYLKINSSNDKNDTFAKILADNGGVDITSGAGRDKKTIHLSVEDAKNVGLDADKINTAVEMLKEQGKNPPQSVASTTLLEFENALANVGAKVRSGQIQNSI